MGKKNNNGRGKPSEDRQMFIDTIKDMRKLIQKNTNSYSAETLGLSKKKTKVPYNHLMGRRDAIRQKYKEEKTRAREESIQYDSSMKLLNSSLMQQKRDKDEFEKNKYKYEGLKGGRIGRETDSGFLEITKKDIDRIYGRSDKKGHGKPAVGGKKGTFKKNFGKGKGKGKGKKGKR